MKDKLKSIQPSEFFGYVYAVELSKNHVKIGRTKNPFLRISAIQSQSGYEALNVWVSPEITNSPEVELLAHKHFKSHRKHGEYFSISFVSAINGISSLKMIVATDKHRSLASINSQIQSLFTKSHFSMGLDARELQTLTAEEKELLARHGYLTCETFTAKHIRPPLTHHKCRLNNFTMAE